MSVFQMDMVEGHPTSVVTAQRGDRGCQARLLDVVVIAEGLEKGGGEITETKF